MTPRVAIAQAAAAARGLADALDDLRLALEAQAEEGVLEPARPTISDTDRARARRVLRQLGTTPNGGSRP
jgi:hypothetical protein